MCIGIGHKHSWIMLVGCAVPLLMIFVLPLLGVRDGWVVPVALAAMLFCHLITANVAARGARNSHSHSTSGEPHVHH